MSDRGYAQLYVYACPEDERGPLMAALYDEDGEIGPPNEGAEDALELGELYGWEETRLDAHEIIAELVIGAAPGATFETWVDPKYEYPGVAVMYAPDLGRWEGLCDVDGVPYVTAHQLRDTRWTGPNEGLSQLAGLRWLGRCEEIIGQLPPRARG